MDERETTPSLQAQPVIIIGAGRSGTNMLRDVLASLEGFATWPCDEINYIWRYGNRSAPTDEFTPEQATARTRRYIRNAFNQIARAQGLHDSPEGQRFVVEKTCANSLRVPFVHAVVPEAKYLYLVRDGRDVIASAQKRWKAELDLAYILAKARYVPKADIPYYGSRYLLNRLAKLMSKESALSVWGPRFQGMEQWARSGSMERLCAAQWARCVKLSDQALGELPEQTVMRLQYEQFVADPVRVLGEVCTFLGYPADPVVLDKACASVNDGSVGKGRLGEGSMDVALPLMSNTLVRHGYPINTDPSPDTP